MNLIEQLGGYEKAKALADSVSDSSTACFIGGCFCSKESLNLIILQYRRQHNIFEVGDKVLFNGCIYTVIEINIDAEMLVIDDGAYGFSVYFSDVELLL